VEDWEVLDLLGGLVNKSLVLLDETEAESRYRLLETVRQYGRERLAGSGEAAVRARHLSYCVALAEEAAPHLRGPAQGEWLARLEAEHDNLRAALGWARERGLVEEGLRLAGALWRFWYTRGHFSEGRGWLAGLLAVGSGSPLVRALALHGAGVVRALALHGAGVLAQSQGELELAAALHEEALALRRAVGDQQGIAISLNGLGNVANHQGEYGRAAALYEESLALYRALEDRWGIATALNNLGDIAMQQEDDARAAVYFEESLALKRALEDRWGIALALQNLGHLVTRQGDHARGVAYLRESLRISHAFGLRHLEVATLDALAQALVAGGQADLGARLGGAAEALREALGMALPVELRDGHERLLARREEAFAAAWAVGRALPLDEAVALALEGEAAAAEEGAGG
jgi:non-specific serine/threonine protein kinase